MANPVEIERLEMLEGQEVKQHHDEQHLGPRQLAGALPCVLRRDQPVAFPVLDYLAEIVETAIKRPLAGAGEAGITRLNLPTFISIKSCVT